MGSRCLCFFPMYCNPVFCSEVPSFARATESYKKPLLVCVDESRLFEPNGLLQVAGAAFFAASSLRSAVQGYCLARVLFAFEFVIKHPEQPAGRDVTGA